MHAGRREVLEDLDDLLLYCMVVLEHSVVYRPATMNSCHNQFVLVSQRPSDAFDGRVGHASRSKTESQRRSHETDWSWKRTAVAAARARVNDV
jgi:hypothetical protein